MNIKPAIQSLLAETPPPEGLYSLIEKAATFGIIGHLEPDGDCLYSQLALADFLDSMGKTTRLLNAGPIPGGVLADFASRFENKLSDEIPDCLLILDTPTPDRMGQFKELLSKTDSLVIDHHITNSGFGTLNWVYDRYVSTAEMVLLLLYTIDDSLLTPSIAQHLLSGMLADNGYYKHIRKEKPDSLLLSYLALLLGADPMISYNAMFGNRSFSSLKLLSLVIERTKFHLDGKIAWTYIREKDKKMHDSSPLDTQALFRELFSLKGVEVVILFKYQSSQKIDISFRSRNTLDVASIANSFGGGGHTLAAGASLSGIPHLVERDVLKKVIDTVKKALP